ncbi:MAG: hypothetical protein HY556_08570 [Euryarchaeota archaeon]|nr:hypothetical protein [Euryarchaeota archaeon]
MIETPKKIAARLKSQEAAANEADEPAFEVVKDAQTLDIKQPPRGDAPPPRTLPSPHEKLFDDALSMTVNRNLDDVATLLQWAREAATPVEKLKHVKRANELLTDVKDSLEELR